jgi:hypothetical protein
MSSTSINATLLEPENFTQAEPDDVRDLRRAIDDELVEAVVAIGQDRASLERDRGLPVHAIGAANNDLGGAGNRIDVAGLEHALYEQIVAPAFVHQAGRLAQRRRGVDHRRQQLELDAHRGGQILGFGARRRDAGGNGLAGIPGLVHGERRIA